MLREQQHLSQHIPVQSDREVSPALGTIHSSQVTVKRALKGLTSVSMHLFSLVSQTELVQGSKGARSESHQSCARVSLVPILFFLLGRRGRSMQLGIQVITSGGKWSYYQRSGSFFLPCRKLHVLIRAETLGGRDVMQNGSNPVGGISRCFGIS